MPFYISDKKVNALANEAKLRFGAETKEEAIGIALERFLKQIHDGALPGEQVVPSTPKSTEAD
jgi:hypothetical protein